MSSKVIVFGPTGNVGSITAKTAHSHGATVFLAMRDVSKNIPDLSKSEEQSGRYHRVQADLTKPETLSAAVESSGATKAFIYLAHGTPDNMKTSIEALKAAGVKFIVFLSSFTIGSAPAFGDLRAVPASEIIPSVHAKVELSLEEVYGAGHYVAIRPGGFATNILRQSEGIAKGAVRMRGSHFNFDLITPDDMGRVSGTILATQEGPRDGQGHIYLFGPQILSAKEAIAVVAKELGKSVDVTEIDNEEAMQQFDAQHVPRPFAQYMLSKMERPQDEKASRPNYQEGLDNIKKYTGRDSMSWEEWVRENKARFEA